VTLLQLRTEALRALTAQAEPRRLTETERYTALRSAVHRAVANYQAAGTATAQDAAVAALALAVDAPTVTAPGVQVIDETAGHTGWWDTQRAEQVIACATSLRWVDAPDGYDLRLVDHTGTWRLALSYYAPPKDGVSP
jgi:hypothetical protein